MRMRRERSGSTVGAGAVWWCGWMVALLLGAVVCRAQMGRNTEPWGSTFTLGGDPTADNSFALDLYARLAAGAGNGPAAGAAGGTQAAAGGNLFFSPYSLRTVLVMAYAGAGGNTATEMANVLRLPQTTPAGMVPSLFAPLDQALNRNSGENYQLSTAEGVFPQAGYRLRSDYVQLLRSNYGNVLHTVNYVTGAEQARKQINQWAQQQTHDKIKDLLPEGSLTPQTRLVLANAIYFKGLWQDPFEPGNTRPQPFHLDATNTAPVPMMTLPRARLAYADTPDAQIVELPYRGNALSMVLMVPRAIDGLTAMNRGLDATNLTRVLGQMQVRPVALSLPKFTFDTDLALADTLKAMGMTDAFDPARANFSGMIPAEQARREPMAISNIYHKAYIALDEQGTEAAAASGASMGLAAMASPPSGIVTVTADRPFLFFIRHRQSGAILFIGRLADPRVAPPAKDAPSGNGP